ncbi:hypothetical protein GJ496_000540, partial [Pomphorhynchus laevis]
MQADGRAPDQNRNEILQLGSENSAFELNRAQNQDSLVQSSASLTTGTVKKKKKSRKKDMALARFPDMTATNSYPPYMYFSPTNWQDPSYFLAYQAMLAQQQSAANYYYSMDASNSGRQSAAFGRSRRNTATPKKGRNSVSVWSESQLRSPTIPLEVEFNHLPVINQQLPTYQNLAVQIPNHLFRSSGTKLIQVNSTNGKVNIFDCKSSTDNKPYSEQILQILKKHIGPLTRPNTSIST